MCGRYGRVSRFERIAQLAALALRNEAGELAPSFNIAPGTQQPVIVDAGEGPVLRLLRWGLVPYWSKDPGSGPRPINAQCETAADKPMFRALMRRRRCLVPADWFYEWKPTAAGKLPHVVRMASGEPFLLAGLWDTWHPGRPDAVASFTVLTCRANERVAPLHERMPLVIAAPDAVRWLDHSAQVSDLLRPFPAEAMTAYPVSRRVNDAHNDGPELIEPLSSAAA